MNHPILAAFNRLDLLSSDNISGYKVIVMLDEREIGEIHPAQGGYHEMAYSAGGCKSIGPAFDLDQMKRRLVFEMFGGKEVDFQRATLKRVKK